MTRLADRPLDDIGDLFSISDVAARPLPRPAPTPVVDLTKELVKSLRARNEPAVPTPASNTESAYRAWLTTKEGRDAFATIEMLALRKSARDEDRISINALVELVRAQARVKINNTYRAWIADDLVKLHPPLDAFIERRRRKARP